MIFIKSNFINIFLLSFYDLNVEVEGSPRMREIGVRSPVATDLSHKTDSDISTAKTLGNR